MEHLQLWITHHWTFLILLPGNLLAFEAVIKNAAEAHGYTKSASLCRKTGNFLSFCADVLSGILARKQVTQTESNPNQPITLSNQKVD